MILSRNKLEELKQNKYAMIVVGPLEKEDKDNLFKTHRNYNGNKTYVGESHIELFCCHDVSSSIRDEYNFNGDTMLLLLKDGFVVRTLDESRLFTNIHALSNMIHDDLGIYID